MIVRGDGPSASEAEACAGVRRIGRLADASLAVLRGFATGLLRREVGVQRHVSVNTVKGHTRELYASWTQPREGTPARAWELGLLDPGESPG